MRVVQQVLIHTNARRDDDKFSQAPPIVHGPHSQHRISELMNWEGRQGPHVLVVMSVKNIMGEHAQVRFAHGNECEGLSKNTCTLGSLCPHLLTS